MDIRLTKHHGLGNDFLVVDLAQGTPQVEWSELARRWCDRRFGVGADGFTNDLQILINNINKGE